MGLLLRLNILGRFLLTTRGDARFAISSVAIGASEANRACEVHGGTVRRRVACQTAGRFAICIRLRLEQQNIIYVFFGRSLALNPTEQNRRSETDNAYQIVK
jgi:hypothetical protein